MKAENFRLKSFRVQTFSGRKNNKQDVEKSSARKQEVHETRREKQSQALKNRKQETGNRSNRNRRKSFLILMFYCLKFEHFNSVIVNMPQTQCAVTQTNSLLIDLYFKCHFVGRSCV